MDLVEPELQIATHAMPKAYGRALALVPIQHPEYRQWHQVQVPWRGTASQPTTVFGRPRVLARDENPVRARSA